MRTSRVSRDTTKIISALTSRTRPTRQTAKPHKNAPEINDAPFASPRESSSNTPGSASDFSAPPSDIDAEDDEPQASSRAASKRKRESIGTPDQAVSRRRTALQAFAAAAAAANDNAGPPPPPPPSSSEVVVATHPRARRARRQPAKKITTSSGKVKMEPPPRWEEMYSLTRAMRARVVAPVDTMGCESLADTARSPRDQRLQTLVALMLSSQTQDTVTAVAMRNLQEGMPGGFNLEGLLEVAPAELNEMIAKVGFHNNKTKFIKQAAEILRDRFAGDIPDTIEGLVSLPGVGPKMAYLCMSAAWGRDEGIGVDVHVHRITNLWGWHKTNTPEETRAALEAWLPREKWHDINNLLVGFGQTICLPVGRKCGECTLSEKGMCPGAVVQKVVKRKVKMEVLENGDGEMEVKEEVDDIVQDIKAEDVEEGAIADIEDIGTNKTRQRRR